MTDQVQVVMPNGQGIYTHPSNHSSGNKHRHAYQQHINNYLADNTGTYYVMRGSADQIGQTIALVQAPVGAGLPPGS